MINKIYICHYTPLSNRKPILEKRLDELGLSSISEWVECYDKEVISEEIKKYPNITKPFNLPGNRRSLKMSEISLILKHHYIWQDMVANNIDNVLILEDDALLCNNFNGLFKTYSKDLPSYYDLLWVGSCCGLHSDNIPDKHIYKENGSRCTHGYMISLKCAKKMVEYHLENNLPCDFMFNMAIEKYEFDNYWLEPDLISQNGKFRTSIQ